MTRKCNVCGGTRRLRPPAWECDKCKVAIIARCWVGCPHSTDANPEGTRWCRLIDNLVHFGDECKVK
jgi:hypothetical protein